MDDGPWLDTAALNAAWLDAAESPFQCMKNTRNKQKIYSCLSIAVPLSSTVYPLEGQEVAPTEPTSFIAPIERMNRTKVDELIEIIKNGYHLRAPISDHLPSKGQNVYPIRPHV